MKKLNTILVLLCITGTLLYSGGIFVEPIYETEDITVAEEAIVEEYPESIDRYIEPEIEEEYIQPEVVEEYVAPEMKEEHISSSLAVEKEEPLQERRIIKKRIPASIPKSASLPIKEVKTNGFYTGIGLSIAKFKPNCRASGCFNPDRDRTAGFIGRVGYDVNQYIGVELRGIRTNWSTEGGKVKHAGVFVKPMIPIGNSSNIYALAGVAKTTTQGSKQRVDTSSFAWGAGVEYDISGDKAKEGRYSREFDGHGDQEKGLGIFADYERLVQKSGSPDLDTLNIGVTYDF